MTYGLVAETAGLAGRGHLIELAECIRTGDRTAALEKIDALYKSSKDMGRLCEELAGFFRNLMLIKTMKDASGLVNAVGEELEAMTKTALSMELSTILHALDAFQSAQSRMKTMNKRTEMEMTFIRLCTPEMDTSPAALLRRIEALERGGLRRPITSAPSVPAAEAPAAPVQQPETPQNNAPVQPAVKDKPPVHRGACKKCAAVRRLVGHYRLYGKLLKVGGVGVQGLSGVHQRRLHAHRSAADCV